jgi:hypothetical protein
MRIITDKYILVQKYADNGELSHIMLFNTITGSPVIDSVEDFEEAQQVIQPDNAQ